MKNITQYFTRRIALFIGIFSVVGFLALQIPITQLMGSGAKFTVFDAFAPITGAFIGSIPGVVAVLIMQLTNFVVHGAHVQDVGTIIRFFPMLFAVIYFARKSSLNLAIPVVAIVAFVAHPIGREVWYFSLFWTIPIFCYFLRERFLPARALGATFTAHAVGGAAWIWAFALPASVWNSLIPIVIAERLLFALGLAVSYVLVNNLLYALEQKNIPTFGLPIDLNFVYSYKIRNS